MSLDTVALCRRTRGTTVSDLEREMRIRELTTRMVCTKESSEFEEILGERQKLIKARSGRMLAAIEREQARRMRGVARRALLSCRTPA